MSHQLIDVLTDNEADTDTVEQAVRLYLAKRTDYLPTEAMRKQLIAAAINPSALDEALHRLETDTEALEAAALMVLSQAWQESDQAPAVTAAVENAKDRLPVIETAILAVVVMYGMYLIATGGVEEITETTTRQPDGTLKTTRKTKWASPVVWVSGITGLFKGGTSGE